MTGFQVGAVLMVCYFGFNVLVCGGGACNSLYVPSSSAVVLIASD